MQERKLQSHLTNVLTDLRFRLNRTTNYSLPNISRNLLGHCEIHDTDIPYIARLLTLSALIVLLNAAAILCVIWLVRMRQLEVMRRASQRLILSVPATATALVIKRTSKETQVVRQHDKSSEQSSLRRASTTAKNMYAQVIKLPSTLKKTRDKQRVIILLAIFDILDGAGFMMSFIDALVKHHSDYTEVIGSFLIYSGYLCSSLLIVVTVTCQVKAILHPMRYYHDTCGSIRSSRGNVLNKTGLGFSVGLGLVLSIVAHVFRYLHSLRDIYMKYFIYGHMTFGFGVQGYIIVCSAVILFKWIHSRRESQRFRVNEGKKVKSGRMLHMGMTAVQIANFIVVSIILATNFMSLRDVLRTNSEEKLMSASECWELVMPYTTVALVYGFCRPVCFFLSLAVSKVIERRYDKEPYFLASTTNSINANLNRYNAAIDV